MAEEVTEEEKKRARSEAKAASERLGQKLGQPDAAWRYEATPSDAYDYMPSGWGEIFK